MNHNEYIKSALLTESHIDEVSVDKDELLQILHLYIFATEYLDAIKKKVFYKNNKKYNTNVTMYVQNMEAIIESIGLSKLITNGEADEILEKVNPRVFHGLLGVITESGEVADALLKYISSPDKIDKVNIAEEVIGDVSWYTAILCDELKIDWSQAMRNNIAKLAVRYPEKFNCDNAANRNLENERKELENEM